jgi:hypothetical protein
MTVLVSIRLKLLKSNMPNKSYYKIRETSKLIEYDMKFAGKHPIWVETYQDENKVYRAIFSPQATSLIPSTITTHDHS